MKVSQRSQVPPFAVMQIIAAANARRAAGHDVINLCAGEPAGGAPRAVRRRAREVLVDESLGYTEATGLPALRAAVAEHYVSTYGVDVDPARVAITTGSSGAFLLTFLAAFDPGDRVALVRPGYPAYRNVLAALGCEVVDLPCGADTRYQPTVEMLAQVPGGLDGLVLASPANPTGTMVPPQELAAIAAWCAEHGVRLVSDEIYHGLTYGSAPQAATAAGQDGAVVVSSFSKYWAMTGWRLGWVVLPPDLVAAVDALAGNVALCPPALAQHAAVAAFAPDAMAQAAQRAAVCERTRAVLLERVPDLGWAQVAPADGAFYLYGDVTAATGLDSGTYCQRLLEEAGVALTPGTDFDPVDGHRFVRLSFATDTDVVVRAVDRVVAWQRAL